ncbi:MAG: hypothetical protein AAFP90_07990 [Planctomycetota bacterium]
MVPTVTWNALLSALSDEEWVRVEEYATALQNCLNKGGFPPSVFIAGDHETKPLLCSGPLAQATVFGFLKEVEPLVREHLASVD